MSDNARTLPGGRVIDDRRSAEDVTATRFFVVATNKFMSGWGHANGCSLFAVPCKSLDQALIVEQNMRNRSEMLRVRVVGFDYRPRLYSGDHLSIRDMSDCDRFYTPGGFIESHGS